MLHLVGQLLKNLSAVHGTVNTKLYEFCTDLLRPSTFYLIRRSSANTVQLLTHEILTKSAPSPKFLISSSISFQCLLHACVGQRFGDATSNVYLLSRGERGVEEGRSSARWIGNFGVTTRITLIFFNFPLLVPQPSGWLT